MSDARLLIFKAAGAVGAVMAMSILHAMLSGM